MQTNQSIVHINIVPGILTNKIWALCITVFIYFIPYLSKISLKDVQILHT